MVMSKGVSPHAFSVVEVDYANVDRTRSAIKDEWRRTEGFSLTYLPFISRATIDALLEFPHLNASVGENELVVHRFVDLGIAVDLDYEGLIVPVIRDAEDLAAARHRPRHQRPRRPGADEEADARRDQRRHVHDLQQRLGRLRADDADHQPAAGGDPVDRRDHPQAGRRRDRPTAARRSPSTPSATWRWRGTTVRSTAPTPPTSCGGSRRSSRRATGRRRSEVSRRGRLIACCASAGSARSRTARRWPSSRRCSTTAARTTCCCSSTRTCSRTARAPTSPRTCAASRPPSAPTSSRIRRGGDITYHGPGQLVGYPIVSLADALGAAAHVRNVEQLVIDTLAELGVTAGRLAEYPGVWVDADGPNPRKICAIGVRLKRGRTMHGFALNVATDMTYLREHIVACGIPDRPVTSLAEEGVHVPMREVVDVVARLAEERWGRRARPSARTSPGVTGPTTCRCSPAAQGPGEPVRLVSRLAAAGVTSGLSIESRKPAWLRPKVHHGPEVLALKRTTRDLGLVTVCEEAGCPNLSECWADGTATFMVLGERCTRACGFCLVDTRKPRGAGGRRAGARRRGRRPDGSRPRRADDGRPRRPRRRRDGPRRGVRRGDPGPPAGDPGRDADLRRPRRRRRRSQLLFAARPDVLNHNLETVARLQRAVRPSAGYARSLSVLARAKAAGLTTKSGLIVGMGETDDEVDGALADLAGIGVDIVTIGQYLRPTSHHLPVERWVEPATFARVGRRAASALGIAPRRGQPADPLQLPRQVRRRRTSRRSRSGSDDADGALSALQRRQNPSNRGGRLAGMTGIYGDRLDRVRKAMADQGVDVLLVSVGHDLPYLSGYEAMPLERLTMLVVPRDGDATLVVPAPRGAARRRAAGRVHAPAVGRDRGPDGDRRPARRRRHDRGRRRPDVGPLPRRAAAAAAGHDVPPGRRRRRAAADGQGRRRDRRPARRRRGRRPRRRPAPRRADPARRAHRGRRSPPTSRPA